MPFQFTLRTLLLLFVLVASALALGEWQGLVATLYLAYLVVSIRVARASGFERGVANLVLAIVILLLAALSLTNVSTARHAARRCVCLNHLKLLGVALYNYHDEYKCFPPAYVMDKSGRPMHSWRVLILPFMEEKSLYAAFRLDEPWDSPHNRKVAARMPDLFRCPAHQNAKPGTTDYVAVTGPGTMWNGDRGCSIKEVTDGTSYTLAIVEASGLNVPWNAPRDLTLEEALAADPTEAITSYHDGSDLPLPMGSVLFADGSVQFIHGQLPRSTFKALATIAGGETVGSGIDDLEVVPVASSPPAAPTPAFLFWSRLIGWSILVMSFAFLVSRPLPDAWTRRAEKLPEKSVE